IGMFTSFKLWDVVPLKATMFVIYANEVIGKPATFMGFAHVELMTTLICVLIIVGALMAGFSREKNEDEFIARIRLESLLWAVYVNYGLLLFLLLFVYGIEFLDVMVFSMFTVLLIFLLRFNIVLYFNKKSMAREE